LFLQSYLIDILNNVLYAVPVEQASFPDKWQCRKGVRDDQGSKTPGGQGGKQRTGYTPPGKGGYGNIGGGTNRPNLCGQGSFGGGQAFNQYGGYRMDPFGRGGRGNHPYGGPNPYQGGGGQHDWKAGWTNIRNHKLKAMIDPYLDRYNGRIHLAEVLNVAGKRQQDLPMLPWFCYTNGRPFLCWNSTLGRCLYRKCRYLREGGHPGPNDVLYDFANKVIRDL
jgi:hypothetical protein